MVGSRHCPSGAPRAATRWQNSPVAYVAELGGRALRVIALSDGETVHDAFADRDFEEKPT
jgi:hypothetical protein